MRPLAEMSTIQIDITSACVLRCSNCTRFCGTHKVPFFINPEKFFAAIDSLVGFAESTNGIVGFMGGEPMLHPQFAEFCDYAVSKIPRTKLGLWSTFPGGAKYKGYREVITRTFGNILLNDHSRDDILHAPVLTAAEDVFRVKCAACDGKGSVDRPGLGLVPCQFCAGDGSVTDEDAIYSATERCWIQESWSASVNPRGAWFCEVAGALADLFDAPPELGWKVEPGWWKKTSKDFAAQREWACRKCGAALPLQRQRNSQDERDDVSSSNLERLKAVKSRKVAKGDYVEHKEFVFDQALISGGTYPRQTYKDAQYRQGIAARYDMYLTINAMGFWEPHLKEDGGYVPPPEALPERPSLFRILNERYAEK